MKDATNNTESRVSSNGCTLNKGRVRSLTTMTLAWLAERLRKQQSVKESLAKGQYEVSSETIAESLLKSSN